MPINTNYKGREKSFTTLLYLGLCITFDIYKSKQKTGFGVKEQKKQQIPIYIFKNANPEIPYHPATNRKTKQKTKKNPTLNNYTTSHCPEAIGKGRRGDVFIE